MYAAQTETYNLCNRSVQSLDAATSPVPVVSLRQVKLEAMKECTQQTRSLLKRMYLDLSFADEVRLQNILFQQKY